MGFGYRETPNAVRSPRTYLLRTRRRYADGRGFNPAAWRETGWPTGPPVVLNLFRTATQIHIYRMKKFKKHKFLRIYVIKTTISRDPPKQFWLGTHRRESILLPGEKKTIINNNVLFSNFILVTPANHVYARFNVFTWKCMTRFVYRKWFLFYADNTLQSVQLVSIMSMKHASAMPYNYDVDWARIINVHVCT